MKILFADLLPGETPIDDASGLLVPGITTRKELNLVEAEGIRKVLVQYFANKPTHDAAPFDYEWSRKLHEDMYGSVWNWAGQFRLQNYNIGVPFAQVQEKLYNLLEDLQFWKGSGMSLPEQATRLHHGAVQIHPFVNGNGRWGRMMTNIWLAIHDSPLIAWPEEAIGSLSPIRDEYIRTLKAADDGDFDPLMAMQNDHLMKETNLPWAD